MNHINKKNSVGKVIYYEIFSLIPYTKVLFGKLIFPQLVKKFYALYGTQSLRFHVHSAAHESVLCHHNAFFKDRWKVNEISHDELA